MLTKPLKKEELSRLGDVVDQIRALLHLEHHSSQLDLCGENENGTSAACEVYHQGWSVHIKLFDPFWKLEPHEQVAALIHECVHAALTPFHQSVIYFIGRLSPGDKEVADAMCTNGLELAVCHMERVLFDLIKDKIVDPPEALENVP